MAMTTAAEFQAESEALREWQGAGTMAIPTAVLARVAEVTPYTAHRWVRGEASPKVHQVRRLEEYRPGLVRRLFPATLIA